MRATLDKRSAEIFKATETLTVVLVGTSNAAAGQELLTGRGNWFLELQKAGKTTDRAQRRKVETWGGGWGRGGVSMIMEW